ncbi:hypothetical protein PRIPAC_78011 [Pristionchus pacificus]|uniref:Uncharacterized protein n=1 Tax=Pristionchus pacificus TaxID=54126 RepID=A0A2A6BXP7_PRIPA|nr:hypothetical protein PRIPAC_78011 [Pristionchus pacificus]|eukprot:PDM70531.1 hypothetical protein PRIPAC_46777 [Pristionchus pacificus]
MGAHPFVDVVCVLALAALAGYAAEHSRAMGVLIVLSLVSILLPLLFVAITQSVTPSSLLASSADNPDAHRMISSMLIYVFLACAKLWTALLWSSRAELPSVLVAWLGGAATVGGVCSTAWLLHRLHEESELSLARSGLAPSAVLLLLALLGFFVGLRGCRARNLLNPRVHLLLCSALFVACAGGAAAAWWLVDGSSDELLRVLQQLSYVATGTAALMVLGAVYLLNEKRALAFGYSSRAAAATAACRVLVKIFAALCILASFYFGRTIHSPVSYQAGAYIALLAAWAVVQGALGYMRFKEPTLRRRSFGIAIVILCHLYWRTFTGMDLGCVCAAAHALHVVTAYLLDRMRGELRPLALPAGLALLACFSSATLYGEITQFFPGQSRSPTVWLAASLAAAGAAQLLAIPVVECFKREAAEEKEQRAEMQAAFRAEARQRKRYELQKKACRELRKMEREEARVQAATTGGRSSSSNGCISCIKSACSRNGEDEEAVEMSIRSSLAPLDLMLYELLDSPVEL